MLRSPCSSWTVCVTCLTVRCLGAESPASSNGEGSGPLRDRESCCEPLLKEGKAHDECTPHGWGAVTVSPDEVSDE